MYLLITSILIVITIFFAVFPKFRKFRDRNSVLTTFIITLVATGAGVFLALYFSNMNETKKEKENAIKLLSISHAEFNGNMKRIVLALEEADQIDDTVYTFDTYIDLFKIEKEFSLRPVIENTIVIKNLSLKGTFLYPLWNDNMTYAYKQLGNSVAKGKDHYINSLVVYAIHLEVVGKILELEKSYIENKISENEIDAKYLEIETEFNEKIIF